MWHDLKVDFFKNPQVREVSRKPGGEEHGDYAEVCACAGRAA